MKDAFGTEIKQGDLVLRTFGHNGLVAMIRLRAVRVEPDRVFLSQGSPITAPSKLCVVQG